MFREQIFELTKANVNTYNDDRDKFSKSKLNLLSTFSLRIQFDDGGFFQI